MKYFKKITAVLFIIMLFFPSADIFAVCDDERNPERCCEIGDDSAHCESLSCPPCAPTPINAGLSFLLLAGVAFGAKLMYRKA